MPFTPELGQLAAGAQFTSHATPAFVTDALYTLDAAYAAKFEGGMDPYARTANHGGTHIVTDVFEMRPYCWCDGEAPGHEDGCPPNFLHKPSGFACHWYKHAGRGATCSRPITATEWLAILTECAQAIAALPQPYVILITGSREYGKDLFETKSRFRPDWMTVPSAQRDAMVAALRGARARAHAAGPLRPLLIRHGAATGADTLAGALATVSGVTTDVWPALWRTENDAPIDGYDLDMARRMRTVYNPGAGYRRQAGPERNTAMVNAGADECLAFLAVGAENRGTRHCAGKARAAGIPVTEVEA